MRDTICRAGADTPLRELVLGQHTGPRIEELQNVRARVNLSEEMFGCRIDQDID